MTKNKRDYIRNAIGQRLHHFKPSVPSEYYNVEFKEIVDINGYIIPDTYCIIIHAAKLYAGDNIKQHVKFLSSQGEAYERRVTSVGFSKSKELTHLKPQEHSELYNKRKAKGITREVNFGVKPKFDIFDGIDGMDASDDNKEAINNDDDDDDNDTDDELLNTMAETKEINPNDVVIIHDDEGKAQMFDQLVNNVEITTEPIADISPTIGVPSTSVSWQSPAQSMSDMMALSPVSDIGVSIMNIPEPLSYTTPKLNSLPIPSNTEAGLATLSQRVQDKLDAMMMITDYMLDPKWNSILTMAANNSYAAQKSTWVLLVQLERETIQKRVISRAKAHQQKAMYIQRQKHNNNNNQCIN